MATPEARAAAIELIGLLAGEPISPDDDDIVPTAEALDRFAAQRGAEADDGELDPGELKPCPFCGGEPGVQLADDGGSFIECTKCQATTPLHYDRCENLIPNWNSRVKSSAQTGGGDAGERAREHASAVLYRVIEHLAKTGEWADEDLDALRAGLAMLDSREADLRSSHREGAGAMRGLAADYIRQWYDASLTDNDAASALPISGKTDAG